MYVELKRVNLVKCWDLGNDGELFFFSFLEIGNFVAVPKEPVDWKK